MFLLHVDTVDSNWYEFEEKGIKQCFGQYGQHFDLVDGWISTATSDVNAIDEWIVPAL